MNIADQRQGELYIILGVILWGTLPVITQLSFSSVSPFTSLAFSSFFAALFFAVILTVRKGWHELKNTKAFIYSLYATIISAILYYLLYFFALRYSSAGNISILALSEAFFSFLLFHVWKKEYIPKVHILGAVFILFGAIIVLAPSITGFKIGDMLILVGAAIVPFGNFYVQKARRLVNTETIMFTRAAIGSIAVFILSFIFRSASSVSAITSSLPFFIANGVLIFGLSNMLWVEGIHRIPVTKANGLNALGPLVTIVFAWFVFRTAPTPWQLVAFVPMFFGVVLISRKI